MTKPHHNVSEKRIGFTSSFPFSTRGNKGGKKGGREGGRRGGREGNTTKTPIYVPEDAHDKTIPQGIGKEDRVHKQLALLHRRLLHHIKLGLLAGQAQGLREKGREGGREGGRGGVRTCRDSA